MPLTQEQIEYVAQRANWYFEVYTNDIAFGSGDSYIITGDGVDDLDRLLSLMPIYPNGRYSVDVGALYSNYQRVDVADVTAIKEAYIAYYGTVDKPGPPTPQTEAIELP